MSDLNEEFAQKRKVLQSYLDNSVFLTHFEVADVILRAASSSPDGVPRHLDARLATFTATMLEIAISEQDEQVVRGVVFQLHEAVGQHRQAVLLWDELYRVARRDPKVYARLHKANAP